MQATEKAGLGWPLLIVHPRLALGSAEKAGVPEQFHHFLRPREGRGEVASTDCLPALCVRDPKNAGFT